MPGTPKPLTHRYLADRPADAAAFRRELIALLTAYLRPGRAIPS